MKNALKTFDDLNFNPHPHAKDMGVSASITLDNGYSLSVVANAEGGDCFYGNHPHTYEVAVFNQRGDFVPLALCDDVIGWQLPHQVTSLMQQFQLDGINHEKLLVNLRADFNDKLVEREKSKFNA